MAYTVFYRKLRPSNFSGIIGQNHIVRTLVNQIDSGRISHAYLFCGTRGTGKTSTAKIFAKALNCYNLVKGEPCNSCESCVSINEGRSMNVAEIDAASNNGVDNIRDIRDEVKYPPAVGKYRVYIIDEVHMLSTGAFNALLKTLEEPPEHVVFILATTDPQKIPATIHSRTQRFDFKRISVESMSATLAEYMSGENVDIETSALRYIAKISDGAMRDALSILDQCVSFYFKEKITLDMVLDITGSVDNSVYFKLCDAISNKNSTVCLEIIEEIIANGRDINQFTSGFVTHLRNLLVSLTASNSQNSLDYSKEHRAELQKQAKALKPDGIIAYINSFSELLTKLKYSSNERVLLEICCIGLCNPQSSGKATAFPGIDDDLIKRLERLEKLENQLSKQKPDGGAKPQKQGQAHETEPKKPLKPKAVPDDIKKVLNEWSKFTANFTGLEAGFLKETKAGYLDNGALYIVCPSMGHVSILKKKEDSITHKLNEVYGKEFDVKIEYQNLYDESHKKLFGTNDNFDYTKDFGRVTKALDYDVTIE